MLLGGIAALSVVAAAIVCLITDAFAGYAWLWMLPAVFAGSCLALAVVAFGFLVVASLVVDTSKPREEDSKFYRALIGVYVDAIVSILGMKIRPEGLENTPAEGRFMLVCNHLSLLDVVVIVRKFRRSQLTFLTKQENLDMFIIGRLMHTILCQPLDRENDRQALKTILKCIQIVKEDKASIGVFPEGARSRDGKLHHFRPGAFKIAQKANVPVVVCTVRNTNRVFSNFLKLRPTRIPLHLLEVIPAEEVKAANTVELAERVHAVMAADLGSEMVAGD